MSLDCVELFRALLLLEEEYWGRSFDELVEEEEVVAWVGLTSKFEF